MAPSSLPFRDVSESRLTATSVIRRVVAVELWQETAGIPVTGTIDLPAWELLDVPTTWGDDANGNGTIEPSEVSLVCDGDCGTAAASAGSG